MHNVTIRKMREEDRAQVMQILAHWNMAPVAPSPAIPDPERTSLILENSFVAVADEAVVGIASYILHGHGFAETASLAIDPGWRGSLIGENLQRARLAEMKEHGVQRVRTESDRREVTDWYVRKFGYQVIGKARKRHPFGLTSVDYWTVLELDLEGWIPPSPGKTIAGS